MIAMLEMSCDEVLGEIECQLALEYGVYIAR